MSFIGKIGISRVLLLSFSNRYMKCLFFPLDSLQWHTGVDDSQMEIYTANIWSWMRWTYTLLCQWVWKEGLETRKVATDHTAGWALGMSCFQRDISGCQVPQWSRCVLLGPQQQLHHHGCQLKPMAEEQYCFSLTMLKLALYSHILTVLSHVAEHFAFFHGNRRFCTDLPCKLLTRVLSQRCRPPVKRKGSARDTTLWFLMTKGFRRDISYSQFHFVPPH